MAETGMENQPQFSLLNKGSKNTRNSSTISMQDTDQRHTLITERLRDALFSAYIANANYVNNAEKIKSEIERRLHQYLPAFHTPTHLPYASMIQRAITELGEEDGSSEDSVSEFIKKEYEDLPWAHSAFLRCHLRKLCESGELVKLECGKYKFKIEDEGVKTRKKKRGKTAAAKRTRRPRDGVEDFDGKKQLSDQVIVGLSVQESLTIKVTEKQSGLLRREIDGAEEEDQHCERDKLGEVVEESMERSYEGPNGEGRPSIETTLEFFDAKSKLDNVEESESIDAQCFKKLQEDNTHVEFFDPKSDQDINELNEMINAQSSNGKILNMNGVSDDQSKLQQQPLKVNNDRNQLDNAETVITLETSIGGSPPPHHQTDTPMHVEQVKTCAPESGENANAEVVLPSDIISSPKSHPLERRGRGRPRKLSTHETLEVSFPSSVQDPNQQLQEIDSEDNESVRPNIHEALAVSSTHHIDQQQHQKPAKGSGKGRGRHRVVKQDQISTSSTSSHPESPHQLHSAEKRGIIGRRLKRKSDTDVLLKDMFTSKNEQYDSKRRCRGRPPKVL